MRKLGLLASLILLAGAIAGPVGVTAEPAKTATEQIREFEMSQEKKLDEIASKRKDKLKDDAKLREETLEKVKQNQLDLEREQKRIKEEREAARLLAIEKRIQKLEEIRQMKQVAKTQVEETQKKREQALDEQKQSNTSVELTKRAKELELASKRGKEKAVAEQNEIQLKMEIKRRDLERQLKEQRDLLESEAAKMAQKNFEKKIEVVKQIKEAKKPKKITPKQELK